jgi:hypothetical protein
MRELVAAVDLRGARRDFLLHELVDGVAQHVDGLRRGRKADHFPALRQCETQPLAAQDQDQRYAVSR